MTDSTLKPNYYLLPSGIEVIEVSEHLSSNGGQIVQYVSRATRLDGLVKGDPVKDLEKARVLLDREIERVKAVKSAEYLKLSQAVEDLTASDTYESGTF